MTRQLALLLFWAWSAVASAPAQTPSPLLLTVYFSEQPPFSVVEGQTGILLELTKEILTEAGLRARFIELPPARILELLRTGQPDALGVGWFKTPERATWGRYSLALYQDKPPVALVNARVAAALPNPVRLDALLNSGLTLGIQSGTSLGPLLDQRVRAFGLVPLETVVDVVSLLKMIQAGRMDYTFLGGEEAEYLLSHEPSLTPGLVLTRLADPLPGNYRYFLYPGSFEPGLAARIDAAIEKVRASPRFERLTALN